MCLLSTYVLCTLKFFILSYSSYILDINIFGYVICKYPLPFIRWPFLLCWWFLLPCKSFLVQFSPIWFNFHFLFFVSFAWWIQKILLRLMSKCILSVFYSRSFKISGLTLKCRIHTEFFFLYDVKKWCSFNPLHIAIQFSQHHVLKKVFSPVYTLASYVVD